MANSFVDVWNSAKNKVKVDMGGIPDGTYRMRLASAQRGYSKNGRHQIHWAWVVADGELEGEQYHCWDGLDNETGAEFAMRKLVRLGVNSFGNSQEDIDKILKDLTKAQPTAIVLLHTREKGGKSFQNMRIQRLITDSEDDFSEAVDDIEVEE